MSNELEFVETQALLNEIMRRCDVGVVTLIHKTTDDESRFIFVHRGGLAESLGLMEIARHRILRCYDDDSEQTFYREDSAFDEDEDECNPPIEDNQ